MQYFRQINFLILLLIFALILWFQACSSSDKHALVTPWLKGDILGEKLVTLADHLCNKDLESTVSSETYFSERWTLLSLVLSQQVKNDYLIGEVYVERIIVKLHETLSNAKKLSEAENNDSSVSFICDVAYNYFSSAKGCLLMPSSEDLLLTLFQLCAQSKEKTHLPGNSLLLKCFVGNLRL